MSKDSFILMLFLSFLIGICGGMILGVQHKADTANKKLDEILMIIHEPDQEPVAVKEDRTEEIMDEQQEIRERLTEIEELFVSWERLFKQLFEPSQQRYIKTH